ncbi:DUF1214 domain-containing protein [Lichenibacterium dinghuense]|uniref:DUF1214 domain-containing protein n=1 Tax=Lichenibacterium dinghuense TaxID=2895977 RepID=UPI001F3EAC49|nr:DUF1214 domain-containing protein [Lichenibacterium sp. 6Y81]
MTAVSPHGRAPALPRRATDGLGERARSPVLPGAGALGILCVGLALGLAATAVVVGRGWDPGAVAIGPWVTRPKVGTTAIDPYARAELARTGAVPLAASEGLSFTATTDDTGYRLLRTCTYRLAGDVPPARFWTLTATDPAGRALGDPARRTAFTSSGVVRDEAGRVAVEVGPEARPGNWLMLSGEGPLTLTLRLYDTSLAGNAGEVADAALPSIVRQGCGGTKS